jgi:hypothetical protein
MSYSLPKQPSLEHLKKSAKRILAAQRNGDPRCCKLLRSLRRFAEATDAEILAARLNLADAQFLVATFYGFASWDQLRKRVGGHRVTSPNSLETVLSRCRHEIPEYAAAGVPLGVVAALNHAGVAIDFVEFVAATGWAFSFAYRYDDISPAYLAVCGKPGRNGPMEVFAFLPEKLGFGYEMAPTQEPELLWRFVAKHVDDGTPIMSEHMDGGLISGYQEIDGRRQLYFDGTVGWGWLDVDDLQPHGVYVLVAQHPPLPREQILRLSLRRAVEIGSAHTWQGTLQGLAALQAYLSDVGDASKSFANCEEWFCWATFQRLMARRCGELWLRSVAKKTFGKGRDLVLTAGKRYGEAFEHYDRYLAELRLEPTPADLHERSRTPERIAVITRLLQEGITAEAAGLDALAQAVAMLD